ncbi:MAG: DNA repair protein RadA [Actinobacteria bacterium]|nr:DNA repair protein RadA [Actinomycetota bacterium]
MAKIRYVARCQVCGYTAPKPLGRCPDCGEWGSMAEEPLDLTPTSSLRRAIGLSEEPRPITGIADEPEERFPTGLAEFDRVLGGGVVPGSLVLIGGEPGVGKSTLLIQAANEMARKSGPVLLVSGEESARQIGVRARRLGTLAHDLFILAEIDIKEIARGAEEMNPALLVVDSIQTMFDSDISSAPGSVSQVREATGHLMRLAKRTGLPVFIVGHVTKEGSIAGPRLLEHIVDTVLYFEGDRHQSFRIIRAVKNRYGSTNEIGVFEMTDRGLIGVTDPSAFFLSQRPEGATGSIAVPTMEGTRPIVVELQALVTLSHLAVPRRMTSGLDYNRLCLTLAVLERRVGLNLGKDDVYVNAVGGVKVGEPAVDLAAALAVASAHKDIPIPADMVAIGEVGLAGEVRFVSQLERRLKEAAKLGFKHAIIPAQAGEQFGNIGLEILTAKTLTKAIGFL